MAHLTSTQAIVLQVVTWKVRIERKKGNEVASITSQDVSDFIGDKFSADVSVKACQNSLRVLTETGRITRHEHKQSGFKSIFAYGLPGDVPEVPVVFLEQTSRDTPGSSDSLQRPSASSQRTSASPLYNSSNKNKNLSKGDVDNELRSSGTTLAPPPITHHPSQPYVPPAGSKAYRSSGMRTEPTKIEGVKSLNSLQAIEELTKRIGAGTIPVPSANPDGYITARRSEES